MRLELRTDRVQFLVTRAPEPKTDQDGRQKRDQRSQEPLWQTELVAIDADGADVIRVATAFEPKAGPGQYVQVGDLVGRGLPGGLAGADAGSGSGAVAERVVTAAVRGRSALSALSMEEAERRELAAAEAEQTAFEAWERAYGEYEKARDLHVRVVARGR